MPWGNGWGGAEWGAWGISKCKLLYVEWIKKVLLYSIENYTQYRVINHNGKEKKDFVRNTEVDVYLP